MERTFNERSETKNKQLVFPINLSSSSFVFDTKSTHLAIIIDATYDRDSSKSMKITVAVFIEHVSNQVESSRQNENINVLQCFCLLRFSLYTDECRSV